MVLFKSAQRFGSKEQLKLPYNLKKKHFFPKYCTSRRGGEYRILGIFITKENYLS